MQSPSKLYLARDLMNLAIEEAKLALASGDIPVGAIILCDGEIISSQHNRVEEYNSPLAHAELLAIEEATSKLRTKFLGKCDMYVTLEPCAMCAGAIVLSRIRRLYIGADELKTGACGSVFNIVQSDKLNHFVDIYRGIGEQESIELISNFFSRVRENKLNKSKLF